MLIQTNRSGQLPGACATCSDPEQAERALDRDPNVHIHYDGPVNARTLARLGQCVPPDRLTVWLSGWSEDTDPAERKAEAQLVKRYGRLGLRVLTKRWQLADALWLEADVVESDGSLTPGMEQGLLADLHCHTQFSHDSTCPLEDMFKAQRDRGAALFAVTDHCDLNAPAGTDNLTPIRSAADAVRALNRVYDRDCLGLVGVELGEGFWYPERYEQVRTLTDYDVIIGSVHSVRYPGYTQFYSQIDFSAFTNQQVDEFMAQYFEDIKTMLLWTDFDIVAHLTGPLCYIADKYGRKVDMSRYSDAIDEILRIIAARNLALEVGTSGYHFPNTAVAARAIWARYYALGGRRITIGSDTHGTKRASADVERAMADARAIGFTEICWFKQRKAHFIPL